MWTLVALLTPAASADPLEDGRSTYAAKCLACHGPEGRGDGPAARALPSPPRDFSSPAFWETTTDAKVRAVITQGLPGTIMRAYPMPPDQLTSLVAYLRSLAAEPVTPR